MPDAIRIDKFLWAVRLYKTRTLAADACRLGKVKCGETVVKPSREVKVGEVYTINIEQFHKTIKVKNLLSGRVSAKLVSDFIEDLTPQTDYDQQVLIRKYAFEKRDKGIGRPTKKERRDIERVKHSEL
ncbi:MAG: RNA-binding S4 domain-containing protein [Bacteroidales bacterium]|jgi:ribosome-associated heat shock protein Hsp15|nr:RNA-binding S4 domain-containing protein [Bacteroidales bacterium]